MTTKDWKKRKGRLVWEKITGISQVVVIKNEVFTTKSNGRMNPVKKLKTKSKALAYAKSYMRKH